MEPLEWIGIGTLGFEALEGLGVIGAAAEAGAGGLALETAGAIAPALQAQRYRPSTPRAPSSHPMVVAPSASTIRGRFISAGFAVRRSTGSPSRAA